MVKTNSDAPIEVVPGGFKFKIRWGFIASALGIVLGGGTLAGLATTVGVGSSVADDFSDFKNQQIVSHEQIEKAFTKQDDRATKQDDKIEDINKVVTSVQTIQQRDIARNEARRITESIKDRREREEAYDRIYELNLKRLQRGMDPCATVNCP